MSIPDNLLAHSNPVKIDDLRLAYDGDFSFHPEIPHRMRSETIRCDKYTLQLPGTELRLWKRRQLPALKEFMDGHNYQVTRERTIAIEKVFELQVHGNELDFVRVIDSMFLDFIDELPEEAEQESGLDLVRNGESLFLIIFENPEYYGHSEPKPSRTSFIAGGCLIAFLLASLIYGAFMLPRLLWTYIAGLMA
ncbi:hypothetical protein KDL44_14290 [bacterium]|nr:hypothetical protein [bacterium]